MDKCARLDYSAFFQTRWLTTDETIRQLAPPDALQAFCERWRILELALFGSALTDTLRPDSDIDLLVTFAPEAEWSLFDHMDMQEELSALLGRPVDLVTRAAVERSRNWIRREAILGSARPIHVSR